MTLKDRYENLMSRSAQAAPSLEPTDGLVASNYAIAAGLFAIACQLEPQTETVDASTIVSVAPGAAERSPALDDFERELRAIVGSMQRPRGAVTPDTAFEAFGTLNQHYVATRNRLEELLKLVMTHAT
jgi:hypothetical protein